MTQKRIGGKQPVSIFGGDNQDDNFIRHQNVNNLELLKQNDATLGRMMELGHEAVGNMNEANADLQKQRETLLKLFYFDEELSVYIDKATSKVSYLERKTYIKKVLLVVLVLLLGLTCVILLLLKMFG